MSAIDELSAGKYVSITSFRRDGTPVATPVWLVRRNDELLVLTQAESGKAKRIRNNTSVLVARCDARGRIKPVRDDLHVHAAIPAHNLS